MNQRVLFRIPLSVDSEILPAIPRTTPITRHSDDLDVGIIQQTVESSNLDCVTITIPNLGKFEIIGGDTLSYHRFKNSSTHRIRNFLLGVCLGTLLVQRGFLVLHGSVVEIDGEAVAFLGNKRAGKSTSSAALLARGHRFLVDDIVAVQFEDGRPMVTPAFPMFKLDPEAFDDDALPAAPAENPETGYGKHYYELTGEFDWSTSPLSKIVLLDPDDGPTEHEVVSGHEALMSVLEHAWPVRLQDAPYVEDEQGTLGDPELDRYARLVEHCTVERLSMPQDHETLDDLGRDLEAALGVAQTDTQ